MGVVILNLRAGALKVATCATPTAVHVMPPVPFGQYPVMLADQELVDGESHRGPSAIQRSLRADRSIHPAVTDSGILPTPIQCFAHLSTQFLDIEGFGKDVGAFVGGTFRQECISGIAGREDDL